jgi:SAM-dependent methyltransferase
MNDTETKVRDFYDRLAFPGHYTWQDLQELGSPTGNYYLDIIEQRVSQAQRILDAGCGSGLITNLMAHRWPDKKFVGIDFAASIKLADRFADQHRLFNVVYQHQDITAHWSSLPYDLIICQGVLHHIPKHELALTNLLKYLRPQGTLLLGLYHPWGKRLQQMLPPRFESITLQQDQEINPYERCFTAGELRRMLPQHTVRVVGPRLAGSAALGSLLKYQSGGIVMYEVQAK